MWSITYCTGTYTEYHGTVLMGVHVNFISGKHGYVFSSEKKEEITEEK